MWKSETLDRCLKIIREVDATLKKGINVHHENRPRELSVVWTADDFQEWRMGYNMLKGLTRYHKSDPRTVWVIAFMTGPVDAAWALEEIDKLEKLKAFW